jgi:hypothetical protein
MNYDLYKVLVMSLTVNSLNSAAHFLVKIAKMRVWLLERCAEIAYLWYTCKHICTYCDTQTLGNKIISECCAS